MNIIDLNAPDNDPIFALVYGASGTGKTHLMGTLGELGRVLIIDIDQGIKTLRNIIMIISQLLALLLSRIWTRLIN